jgi:SAM-dependent methyltransferase
MSNYLLASATEAERLQLQARVWQPAAEAMLDGIGIEPGWSCLDLGCGAMGILGPLSQRVGPNGRIIGVDADQRSLNVAQEYLHDQHLTNVELLERNVLQTGLPDATFDLVHERFVLPYVTPPEPLVQEMVRLVRPGGWVVIQEPDNTPWTFYPPDPRWSRFKAILIAAFALRGDIDIGQRTYGMLRHVGLTDLQIRAAALALPPQHPYMHMPLMAMAALRPHILQHGLAQPDELEELVAYVTKEASNPHAVQITFITTQVWGRKPTSDG